MPGWKLGNETAHGSRLTAHGSRLTAHGSRLNKQQTTNNKQQTTNNKQQTTKSLLHYLQITEKTFCCLENAGFFSLCFSSFFRFPGFSAFPRFAAAGACLGMRLRSFLSFPLFGVVWNENMNSADLSGQARQGFLEQR
ncbi:MAG: hypothetical protein LBO79_00100 [Zoogloeaceae bacterium]|nr:hypothetical protein [Zoogloeaceae bacterium]